MILNKVIIKFGVKNALIILIKKKRSKIGQLQEFILTNEDKQ